MVTAIVQLGAELSCIERYDQVLEHAGASRNEAHQRRPRNDDE